MTKLSYDELEIRLADAKKKVAPGSKWRHYKGGEYTIVTIAVQEIDQQPAVIYSPIAHPKVSFVRPFSVWDERVEWEGQQVLRFSKI